MYPTFRVSLNRIRLPERRDQSRRVAQGEQGCVTNSRWRTENFVLNICEPPAVLLHKLKNPILLTWYEANCLKLLGCSFSSAVSCAVRRYNDR